MGLAPPARQEESHVTADVIKDVRAKLRPPASEGGVDDLRRVDTMDSDKANARARRLQRRHQLRRSFSASAPSQTLLTFRPRSH